MNEHAAIRLRQRLNAGEPMIGTFVNLGSPLATEACAAAGFDWLLVDLEHGGGDEATLALQLMAADAHGVPVLVRVESDARIRSGRVLDLGASGVMFPRLGSLEEARAAMGHLRYPPIGDRGAATYNRAALFDLRADYLAWADQVIVGVVQIETLGALEAVEDIAALPGVDVLFVGPRDLSIALGVPGQFDAEPYRDALRRVVAAAQGAGIAAGILAPDAATAHTHQQAGFTFVGVGSDSAFLAATAQAATRALHAEDQTP